MFVHDLNQFVTTPAVLSLGNLCKDHGYSYEWVSGQEPRLTNNGKSITCKTDNFVPLVAPRLSTNSGSDSSSTSPPQDSSSSPSGSVSERSDELATGRLGQESLSDDKKDPLADLPFWEEEDFTDNVEDTEVPALAHSSRVSDPEHPPKVVSKSRKHSIYTHFPKDRNCDVCLRTNITKASCR